MVDACLPESSCKNVLGKGRAARQRHCADIGKEPDLRLCQSVDERLLRYALISDRENLHVLNIGAGRHNESRAALAGSEVSRQGP